MINYNFRRSNMQDLKNLKSGSDIRGIAIGENINLTNDAVKSIAMAFVKFLEKKKEYRNKKSNYCRRA